MSKLLITVIKYILTIILIPYLVAATKSFGGELIGLKNDLYGIFLWGVLSYTIVHLVLGGPRVVYQVGQKVLGDLFGLFPKFATIMSLSIPLLATLVLIIQYVLHFFFQYNGYEKYFLFLTGFFLAHHIIFTAQDLREEDTNIFKPHYFFALTLVYIINLIIISALLGLNYEKYSALNFLQVTWENGSQLYQQFTDQLWNLLYKFA